MQMIVEIELTIQFKKYLNCYRFVPGYTISQNPTHGSFGKVNTINLQGKRDWPQTSD